MVAQPPVQNNANNSTSSNQPAQSLLSDPTFTLLHHAFLLGWSITELKSRVQIAACSKKQLLNFTMQTQNLTAGAQDASQKHRIDALIKDIILADLSDITTKDINTLVQQANKLPSKSLPTDLSDREWLSSILRAIFKRIVALHINRFPASSTKNTIYDLGNLNDPKSPYNYLFPQAGTDDYTGIGIAPLAPAINSQSGSTSPANPNQPTPSPNPQATGSNQQGRADASSPAFVQDFKLYDATRRAINCLTLLLTNAKESLIPEIIEKLQQALVRKALKKPDSTTQISDDDATATIKKVGGDIASFLDAWDSYLHETYFSASAATRDIGDGESDGTKASNTRSPATSSAKTPPIELELTAFEAGRSLANLSWGASMILAPLESLFQSGQDADKSGALVKKARDTWLNVFNDRDVNHVQHQINALSTAFDEAFYRVNPNIKSPDPNDLTNLPNPELPSQAIQAVVQSLNYWQRTITRICTSGGGIIPLPGPQPGNPWKDSQAANTAEATRAYQKVQQLQTTQQKNELSEPLMTWDRSINLRTELVQQSYIWQSLLLCQQSLQAYSLDKVTQRILDEFMGDLELTIKKELRHTTIMWMLFGAIVVIIVVLLLYLAAHTTTSISNLIPIASITALGALIAPFINGIRSRIGQFWSYLGSRFGAVGTTIEQGLERGYKQVLIEFNYLNHNVGITYPLVEFFLWQEIEFDGNAVKDGYDFLIHVFWTGEDREEELQRVARAAFGPIGAYVGTQLHTEGTLGRLWSRMTSSGSK